MLSYLLASHPQTTAATLTTIINHPGTLSPAMGAALTHPALPPDAPLPTERELGSAAVGKVLACPRITAQRRARVLSWTYRWARASLVRNSTDLTADEVVALAGSQPSRSYVWAQALARNPATPPGHLEHALRALAESDHPATIAVFTEARGLDAAFIAELAATLVNKRGHTGLSYFPGLRDTHTPTDLVLDAPLDVLREVIENTASHTLIERALDAGLDVKDAAYNALHRGGGTDNPATVAFADRVLGRKALDDPATLADLTSAPVSFLALSRYLTCADLRPQTLTAVVAVALDDPPTEWSTRGLVEAAAHPATPTELLAHLAARVNAAPAPALSSTAAPSDGYVTHHLAVARVNGSTRPALDLPMPLVRDYPDEPGHPTVISHQIRATVEAHPGWPLDPPAAHTLLTLEPTFPGTIGELLDTATAITT